LRKCAEDYLKDNFDSFIQTIQASQSKVIPWILISFGYLGFNKNFLIGPIYTPNN